MSVEEEEEEKQKQKKKQVVEKGGGHPDEEETPQKKRSWATLFSSGARGSQKNVLSGLPGGGNIRNFLFSS